MKFIRKHFTRPTVQVLAKESSYDYARRLLDHEAAAAYHAKLAEYYREGISRLATYSQPA